MFIVAVGGSVGSGKTEFCNLLCSYSHDDFLIIPLELYIRPEYLSLPVLHRKLRLEPKHFDDEALKRDLISLRKGQPVTIQDCRVDPKNYRCIIVKGTYVHALERLMTGHSPHRESLDFKNRHVDGTSGVDGSTSKLFDLTVYIDTEPEDMFDRMTKRYSYKDFRAFLECYKESRIHLDDHITSHRNQVNLRIPGNAQLSLVAELVANYVPKMASDVRNGESS